MLKRKRDINIALRVTLSPTTALTVTPSKKTMGRDI